MEKSCRRRLTVEIVKVIEIDSEVEVTNEEMAKLINGAKWKDILPWNWKNLGREIKAANYCKLVGFKTIP